MPEPAAAVDRSALHSQIDAAVAALTARAHAQEGHKVERIQRHLMNLHGFIEDVHGGPNLVRVYSDLGSGRHTEQVFTADDDGNPVEPYDPAVHGGLG